MQAKRIAAALVIAAASISGAQAQVTVDFSKITCEQFAFSKVGHPGTLSIWLSGYYAGKRGTPVIDVQGMRDRAAKMELYCKQKANLKQPLMEAVEQVLGAGR